MSSANSVGLYQSPSSFGVVIEAEGQLGHVDVLAAQLWFCSQIVSPSSTKSLLPALAVGLGFGQDLVGPGEGESLC